MLSAVCCRFCACCCLLLLSLPVNTARRLLFHVDASLAMYSSASSTPVWTVPSPVKPAPQALRFCLEGGRLTVNYATGEELYVVYNGFGSSNSSQLFAAYVEVGSVVTGTCKFSRYGSVQTRVSHRGGAQTRQPHPTSNSWRQLATAGVSAALSLVGRRVCACHGNCNYCIEIHWQRLCSSTDAANRPLRVATLLNTRSGLSRVVS